MSGKRSSLRAGIQTGPSRNWKSPATFSAFNMRMLSNPSAKSNLCRRVPGHGDRTPWLHQQVPEPDYRLVSPPKGRYRRAHDDQTSLVADRLAGVNPGAGSARRGRALFGGWTTGSGRAARAATGPRLGGT